MNEKHVVLFGLMNAAGFVLVCVSAFLVGLKLGLFVTGAVLVWISAAGYKRN